MSPPSMKAKFGSVRSGALEIDRYVGARLRERRIMLGLSQQQVADLIGVTYQQGHKYEHGINRISAGRLFSVARVLGVAVDYFFEGMNSAGQVKSTSQHACSWN